MPRVAWENNILGFIPKEDWLNVGLTVARPNDPVASLFVDQKTNNLVAAWESIASQFQIPVMAQFHGFDTETQKTFRVPVDTHNIEKGLIKVKIDQSERLRALMRSGVQNDELYDYVFNDGLHCADNVVTRTQVAKNELLATGKVTIKENNLDLTVDYGVPDTQTHFTIDLSVDADVPAQLQELVDSARSIGVILNGFVTSRKVMTKLRKNEAIQKAINGTYGTGALVRETALRAYLDEEYGLSNIITNDLTYGSKMEIGANGRPEVTSARFYPEDKISFFATMVGGRIGSGLWGDPPESDVSTFGLNVAVSQSSPFVYVSQYVENDPVILWTKASTLFMPILYNPNSLWIAKVVDGNEIPDVTVAPMNGSAKIWGHDVSDLQDNIVVSDGKITGTLKYVNSGTLAHDWGAGNFMALQFSAGSWDAYDSVKVGLTPTAGSGLAEILTDPDKNGSFKVTDKNLQKFVIVATKNGVSETQTYDLTGLNCQEA